MTISFIYAIRQTQAHTMHTRILHRDYSINEKQKKNKKQEAEAWDGNDDDDSVESRDTSGAMS